MVLCRREHLYDVIAIEYMPTLGTPCLWSYYPFPLAPSQRVSKCFCRAAEQHHNFLVQKASINGIRAGFESFTELLSVELRRYIYEKEGSLEE